MIRTVSLKTTVRTIICIILASLAVTLIVGCNAGTKGGIVGKKKYLAVNYEMDKTLRYKFVSSRDIEMEIDSSRKSKNGPQKFSESLEMIIAYTPVEVNPYGQSKIKAVCESVNVSRSGFKGASSDAMAIAKGKSFTFTVGPTGEMIDKSQLEALLKELGKNAFRSDKENGLVKEPDMISDFFATQWFLNDAVASIKNSDGVSIGQSWDSILSIPSPMIMKKARNVVYTLENVTREPLGRIALINSSYSLAEEASEDWPMPYSGSFKMSGTFGFIKGHKIVEMHGTGSESFNIDTGQALKYEQQYTMVINSSLIIPLGGVTPRTTIDQKITMQLLDE